jgi:AraC-like DNA-binding protein
VFQVLKEKLQTGDTTITNIASLLNMSPRTLHRKLKDAGTSYNELREKLRRELATTYLNDHNINLSDISYLLGFSQVSAFHRAFKRWTGVTPQHFRESSYSSE